MRASLVAVALVVPAFCVPSASAYMVCSQVGPTVYPPPLVGPPLASGIVACDRDGDGLPDLVVLGYFAGAPGVGSASWGASAGHLDPFVVIATGGGASVGTPLGPAAVGASGGCATDTQDLGCDQGDASLAAYAPGAGAFGLGGALRPGSLDAGASLATMLGTQGAYLVSGRGGAQACVSTVAALECSPLLP